MRILILVPSYSYIHTTFSEIHQRIISCELVYIVICIPQCFRVTFPQFLIAPIQTYPDGARKVRRGALRRRAPRSLLIVATPSHCVSLSLTCPHLPSSVCHFFLSVSLCRPRPQPKRLPRKRRLLLAVTTARTAGVHVCMYMYLSLSHYMYV